MCAGAGPIEAPLALDNLRSPFYAGLPPEKQSVWDEVPILLDHIPPPSSPQKDTPQTPAMSAGGASHGVANVTFQISHQNMN